MVESPASAANPTTDAIQRTVHEGVSGIAWMVVGLMVIQLAALLCGAMVARSMFPDSKKKRALVFALAELLGAVVCGVFVILWMRNHGP
jgi:hypothetical protein